VAIRLERKDGLVLVVEDDGVGFSADHDATSGFGLVSMRERAEALGGTLELTPGEGGGVRLEVRLP
jgi:signal transduction histidine kinase